MMGGDTGREKVPELETVRGTQWGFQETPAFNESLWSWGCGWVGGGLSQVVSIFP